jgi:capsid protein
VNKRKTLVKARKTKDVKASFERRPFITPSPADSRQRSLPVNFGMDAAMLAPDHRHRQMVSDGRQIYTQFGVVSGAVHRKADMAVGDSWVPIYTGKSQRFKDAAEPRIQAWSRRCNVRGAPFSLAKDLWLLSKAVDVDGDGFLLFTRDSDGWPRHQLIESHRVAQAGNILRGSNLTPPEVADGRYKGNWIHNGVIMDRQMRPLAYRVVNPGVNPIYGILGPDQYRDISARSMTMVWDPTWASSARGIPSLCYGILDWYDAFETRDNEKIAVKINSALTLVNKNETGTAPATSDDLLGTVASGNPTVENLSGGLIRYIQHADTLESHKSERPSGGWQWLMDHCIRCAMLGMDMPMETVYDIAKLGGASVRAVYQQMQRAVTRRQAILWTPARRMVHHAVATFMSVGDLPFVDDWYEWDFTYPANATVDVGRDSQNRREDFRLGLSSLSDIAGEQGESAANILRRRANDWLIADAIAKETGVPMDFLVSPEVTKPPGITMIDDGRDDEE